MNVEEEFLERCRKNKEPLKKIGKIKLTLSIRKDVVIKAKELEINISNLLERLLIHIIAKQMIRDNNKMEEEND